MTISKCEPTCVHQEFQRALSELAYAQHDKMPMVEILAILSQSVGNYIALQPEGSNIGELMATVNMNIVAGNHNQIAYMAQAEGATIN